VGAGPDAGAGTRANAGALNADLARIPVRRLLILSPTIRFALEPGDRVLVSAGDPVQPGTPLAERTPEATLVEVGALARPAPRAAVSATPSAAPREAAESGGPTGTRADGSVAAAAQSPLWRESEPLPGTARPEADLREAAQPGGDGRDQAKATPTVEPAGPANGTNGAERRRPPYPGKWWVGGAERRGQPGGRREPARRVAGTLLFEMAGRWRAVAGERHEIVEAPAAGVVTEARNGIGVSVTATGVGLRGAVASGTASRGYLDVPALIDGELQPRALDVGRSGAVIVAGTRVSAEALIRARAMSIRAVVAGSIGQAELRDLTASEARQRAGLSQPPPFAVLALEGYLRRPIPSPVLALLASLAGHDVAVVTDPPLLVFETAGVSMPEIGPDWIRVRSGPLAGREGRWVGPAGIRRFRSGVHLEAAFVRLGADSEATVVALNDLERLVF
jgi:hypothetical protein